MKVLLAEDSAVDRRIITQQLKQWGFEPTVVTNGSQAWKLLQSLDVPRLVLLDWVLPEIDGIEVCRRLRSLGSGKPYVYVVVVTAKGDKQDLLRAMEAGADDYLVKPFDELELKGRLIAGRRILDLQEQLLRAGESLRFAATHDPLTGLWNRAEILNCLDRELVRADRERRPLAIILADLDHFKELNDTLGHLAGDSILREVGKRLQSSARIYDGVGRYGGEEFLVVLPGCDLETAARRANDWRAVISGRSIIAAARELTVTLSLGVAAVTCADRMNLEEVLQRADEALYRAKREGRNRVEVMLGDEAEKLPKNKNGGRHRRDSKRQKLAKRP